MDKHEGIEALDVLEEVWVSAKAGTGTSAGSGVFELLVVDD